MKKLNTVETIARAINQEVENSRLFWAYGLLSETFPLWAGKNMRLLSSEARVILRSVKKYFKERKRKDVKKIK
jgi:hypothetical protein